MRDAEIAALAKWHWARWQRAIEQRDDRAIGALERLGAEVRTGIISKHHDWEQRPDGSQQPSRGWKHSDLTPSELRVLTALADGLSYAEAATRLKLSKDSVKDSGRRAREKLEARNTAHAVAIALRGGIID